MTKLQVLRVFLTTAVIFMYLYVAHPMAPAQITVPTALLLAAVIELHRNGKE